MIWYPSNIKSLTPSQALALQTSQLSSLPDPLTLETLADVDVVFPTCRICMIFWGGEDGCHRGQLIQTNQTAQHSTNPQLTSPHFPKPSFIHPYDYHKHHEQVPWDFSQQLIRISLHPLARARGLALLRLIGNQVRWEDIRHSTAIRGSRR